MMLCELVGGRFLCVTACCSVAPRRLRTRFTTIGNRCRGLHSVRLSLSVSHKGPNFSGVSVDRGVFSLINGSANFGGVRNVSYHGCNKLSKLIRLGSLFTRVLRLSRRRVVINKGSSLGVVFSAVTRTVARNLNTTP